MNISLLPTPLVMDTGGNLEKVNQRRIKAKAKKINGNGFGVTLKELNARKLLPTPIASDCRDRGGPKNKSVQRCMDIGKQVGISMMIDGLLNPLYVEEMMGFPEGWTLQPFQKNHGKNGL